ncbi:PD-(D/E)XK nuclease family protein [Candidatus Woesearchaeota archaeon]|nr:PD-(D/E)XK nuclease family protein [Candidatus Woesearchaeota archaeon]MCF7901415.1 PD-(D/E)XK nuclease family protein [Candidatus Woesearchaeota archaeon]MCF8012972.1 PD-(D/E)XK nuclease family protein [Candidatus Woesearchaeota archaeon]
MILKTSLKHNSHGYYHYRIHSRKIDKLCKEKYLFLKEYLHDMLQHCPHEKFLDGPRSSVLKFKIGSNLKKEQNQVEILARIGLDSNYYQEAHMNVQMFMLAYDEKTIAIETPIWLQPEELENYENFFETNLPLSGHIDLVRIEEDNKIWIWDYKPNAHREKYADTQTYFYALMLSKRTKIPLENFMCGYFDDKNTYIFDPNEIKL